MGMKNVPSLWSWLCAAAQSLLAGMSGMVFDHLARAIISLIKIGSFEVYVSPLIYKWLIPVTLAMGFVSFWLCRKGNQPRVIEQISIILTVIPVLGFVLLMAIAI